MKLLEYEGKAMLARHGIATAPGALWPDVPESERGWIVKAQVLAGGRGKMGGVLHANDRAQLGRHAAQLDGRVLGNENIRAVYVEQRLEISHEYYLAALVNRDAGKISVIASASGGIDIERVSKSEIVRVEIDVLIGLQAFQIQRLKRWLTLADDLGPQFKAIVSNLVSVLIAEDAELIEINPVIQTPAGQLVAADAKIVLDDDAVSRHPARPKAMAWELDGAFMQQCRELGVIGVDNRSREPAPSPPTVAVLGNGAGLTMATYDQIALSGLDVVGAIELHGALSRGVAHTAEVIGTLFMLSADLVFINAFYQLRSCEALAKALVQALGRPGAPSQERVVVRMRGVDERRSQDIMDGTACFHSGSLRIATDHIVNLANSFDMSSEQAR